MQILANGINLGVPMGNPALKKISEEEFKNAVEFVFGEEDIEDFCRYGKYGRAIFEACKSFDGSITITRNMSREFIMWVKTPEGKLLVQTNMLNYTKNKLVEFLRAFKDSGNIK